MKIACCVLSFMFWFAADCIAETPLIRAAGNHIRLTTDGDRREAQTMVTSIDAAVNLWSKRWNVPAERIADLVIDACVMNEEKTFRDAFLLPPELPDFSYGYALGNRVFIRAQPGDYYTRHLLLHEAAHAFGFHCFDELGPTWFMEGTAELMATHRGSGGEIEIGVFPTNRQDFAYWGRFKEIAAAKEASQVPSIEKVMRYAPTLAGDVRSYAFSWAAVSMIDAYPPYRGLLSKAARFNYTSSTDFNRQFAAAIRPEWSVLAARWRLWVDSLDYAVEPQRHLVDLRVTDPAMPTEFTVDVVADRGWQSTGYRIAAGTTLSLAATGEAIIDTVPAPWKTTPRGVTLRYVRGRPIGQLIATLVACQPPGVQVMKPREIHAVAPEAIIRVDRASWLCLKLNDQIGQLGDNVGQYKVKIDATTTP